MSRSSDAHARTDDATDDSAESESETGTDAVTGTDTDTDADTTTEAVPNGGESTEIPVRNIVEGTSTTFEVISDEPVATAQDAVAEYDYLELDTERFEEFGLDPVSMSVQDEPGYGDSEDAGQTDPTTRSTTMPADRTDEDVITERYSADGHAHETEPTTRALPSGDELARRLLADVADLVNSDRDTHGDAVENQEHIASGWTWYLRGQGYLDDDEEITGGDVGRMMALLKLSRTAVGEYDVDHDRDGAGYLGIAGACETARGNSELDALTVTDYADHE